MPSACPSGMDREFLSLESPTCAVKWHHHSELRLISVGRGGRTHHLHWAPCFVVSPRLLDLLPGPASTRSFAKGRPGRVTSHRPAHLGPPWRPCLPRVDELPQAVLQMVEASLFHQVHLPGTSRKCLPSAQKLLYALHPKCARNVLESLSAREL